MPTELIEDKKDKRRYPLQSSHDTRIMREPPPNLMKLNRIRIENFRSFEDETINFDDYTCFVGRNGAGKSTILTALNIFFRETVDAATDLLRLCEEDFHAGDTSKPVRVTATVC